MKELFADLDRWQALGEQVAIATLVRVCGSAPRRPGARMLVTRGGGMAGSVSGGCVENDVVERALLVLEGGEPVVATYGVADDEGLEVGLSCGGSIDVLIEPFTASEPWREVRRAVESEERAALALGLAPRSLIGRNLAVLNDGRTVGSLDAALDGRVADEALRLLHEGGTRVLTLEGSAGEGTVFVEAFAPAQRLFIVGASHTAMALAAMAKRLGFRITVIDARRAYLTRERFPDADELSPAHPAEILEQARLDSSSYVVTLTHDPKFDLPALARALRSEARYVGAMGSRSTHERRKTELRRQGFGEVDLARLRAPVGLDIGGRTPEEIAVSILAEMVAVRNRRDGAPLAGKQGAVRGEP